MWSATELLDFGAIQIIYYYYYLFIMEHAN